MPHEFDVEYGEIGDNGYHHETWKCIHCGKVDAEFTPEEVKRNHITEMIIAGEVVEDQLHDEYLEEEWVQEAIQTRDGDPA